MAISDNYNSLTFDGVNSLDYGIYISGPGVYDAPTRAVDFVDVPGRNGAVEIDQGHWNNIEVTYTAGTFAKSQEEFSQKMKAFRNAIVSQVGYQRLTDTYHPEHYRLGVFAAGISAAPVHYSEASEFSLTFNCKPQRFLTSGETKISVANGDVLTNPTLYDAGALFEVDGYGAINIENQWIQISNDPYGQILMRPGSEETKNTSAMFTLSLADADLMGAGDIIGTPSKVKIVLAMYFPGTGFNWDGNWTIEGHNPSWSKGTTTIGGIQCPTATFYLEYEKGTPATVEDYAFYKRNYRYDDFLDAVERVIKITVTYDGDSTITITATGLPESGERQFETVRLTVNDIYGYSNIPATTITGDPIYIDLDVGEVWKRKTTPYGEVFMRPTTEERKDLEGSPGSYSATFPVTLLNPDMLLTGDKIGNFTLVITMYDEIPTPSPSDRWKGNWTNISSDPIPYTHGVKTIDGFQCPTCTFDLQYQKGTPSSISTYGWWERRYEYPDSGSWVEDYIERTNRIYIEYDGDDEITVRVTNNPGSGAHSFPTAIVNIADIYGYSTVPVEGIALLNNIINLPTDIPALKPGDNTITYTSTIAGLKVTPRWWEL